MATNTPSENPNSVSDNPNSVFDNPNSVFDNPNSVFDNPNSVSDNPNSVFNNPNSVFDTTFTVYFYETDDAMFENCKVIYESPKEHKSWVNKGFYTESYTGIKNFDTIQETFNEIKKDMDFIIKKHPHVIWTIIEITNDDHSQPTKLIHYKNNAGNWKLDRENEYSIDIYNYNN